jgi:hypothetical protein
MTRQGIAAAHEGGHEDKHEAEASHYIFNDNPAWHGH